MQEVKKFLFYFVIVFAIAFIAFVGIGNIIRIFLPLFNDDVILPGALGCGTGAGFFIAFLFTA